MPGKAMAPDLTEEEKIKHPLIPFDFWDGHNVDDIYDAFAFAETGSFDNPWIRTAAKKTPGGSTAYGPVQLTGGLLDDYYNNERAIWNDNSDIAEILKGQSTLFNWFGNEPNRAGYEKRFDYGQTGWGLTDIQKGQYKDLTQDMMLDMWNKNKNKNNPINSFIEAWRGVPEDEDQDYYKRFNTHLGR